MLIDVTQTAAMIAAVLLPVSLPPHLLGADAKLTLRKEQITVVARLLVATVLGLLIAFGWPLASNGFLLMWIGVEREIHVRRRNQRLSRRGLEAP